VTWELSLAGLLIGLLVGMTGMGGGSLMTPLLVLVFGFKPTVAIGTDILHGAIFKSFGAWRHRSLGTVHAHLTLWMLLDLAPPLVTSFILETANRLIIVLFKFVPMQQPGLNEAGTVLVAQALGLSKQIASTLAIVRRTRMLFWQFVGTALLVRHGVTTRRILHDRELNEQRVHQLTTRSTRTTD